MTRAPAVLLALSLCAGGLALATPAAADQGQAEVPNSKPPWAAPANKVADAPPTARVVFRVYLQMQDLAGAEALAQAVADPDSPAHGRYLSAEAVLNRFGPTVASVNAVQSWLRQAGFLLGYVPANRMFVEATGSVDQVERAFGTHLSIYAVKGQHLRASDKNLSVPAALASTVTGVVGVDQALTLMRPDNDRGNGTPNADAPATTPAAPPGVVPPPNGFRNAPPCSAYWGEKVDTTDPPYPGYPNPLPYAPCGYKPEQIRRLYGTQGLLNFGLDGSGATVAIVDAFASPNIFADASEYARRNDPAHPLRPDQLRQVVFPPNGALEPPDQCGAAGWYGEETLDVEAVHATAPGAKIVYVGGSDCLDVSLDKALNEVVSKHLAQIVSNSYGDQGEDLPADVVAAFQQIAIQGVLQGIGIYFSSGDSGDEAANLNGQPSPDFPASSPWVTAVGGTSVGIGADGQRVFETGWETTRSILVNGQWTPPPPGAYLYGSGGGTSRLFRQPFYQRGVVPDALARKNQTKGNKGRVVPDVAAIGDPNTGFLIGITQTFPDGVHYGEYRIGGTSLSSPIFAGIAALADDLTGTHHGFLNPLLYKRLNRTPGLRDVQHVQGADIRVDYVNAVDASNGLRTSVRTFDYQGLSIKTRSGYDDVTGLGTPEGIWFLFELAY